MPAAADVSEIAVTFTEPPVAVIRFVPCVTLLRSISATVSCTSTSPLCASSDTSWARSTSVPTFVTSSVLAAVTFASRSTRSAC